MLLVNDEKEFVCPVCQDNFVPGHEMIEYCSKPDHLVSIRFDVHSYQTIIDIPIQTNLDKQSLKAIVILENGDTELVFASHEKRLKYAIKNSDDLTKIYNSIHGFEIFQ